MIRTHTFKGVKYCIQLAERVNGFCEAPKNSMPCIAIMLPLEELDGFETAIHEALHASNFDKDETTITQTAYDISRFLWRLGYRRVKPKGK